MTTPENKFSELETLFKTTFRSDETEGVETSHGYSVMSLVKGIPKLPDVQAEKDEKATSLFWRRLRSFYRNAEGGGILDESKRVNLYPALLMPYQDMRQVRYDYPVWLAGEGSAADGHSAAASLDQLLLDAVHSFSSSSQAAKILRDNIGRLELMVRESIGPNMTSIAFAEVMEPALRKLESELNIKGQEGTTFSEDIQKLKKALPQSGRLVPFSPETPFLLLAEALHGHFAKSRYRLSELASKLRSQMEEVLRVEREKDPQSRAPQTLKDSYGYGGTFINFRKFADVIPDSASESMTQERLERIKKASDVLAHADDYVTKDALILITGDSFHCGPETWPQFFPSASLLISDKQKSCAEVMTVFENHMSTMTELIRSLRIGRLEMEGRYDPEVHDAYFAHFDWQAFSDTEMSFCAPVIMITAIEELMDHGLTEFSKILASHNPIKTLVIKQHARPAQPSGVSGAAQFSFPQELGAMAVAHRNTYVFQSSSIHPKDLYEGFLRGVSNSSPALFYVLSPKDDPEGNAYVWAGAALESRVFPEFAYDQAQGVQWGSRFNVERNPRADLDWPVYPLPITDAGNQTSVMHVPFTFADFAAQDVNFARHFLDVPPAFWTDDLVPYSDYLKMPPTEAYTKIPFIWMIDRQNVVHKVATTHFVVLFGQERLDFWHFIQEFGGINSYHVEQAVKKVREVLSEEKANEIAALGECHRSEIEQVRKSAAREAMEKLSAILLELDTVSVRSAEKTTATAKAPAPATQPAAEPEPPKPVEEEVTVSTEPWIESVRCTSCNECLNVNPNLFKYNGSKQAYITDAKNGTFAQMVKASEKCPAKCIHPGMPLNPNETGLEDLIKRAAPFN
jgi:ferredoxin